MHETRLTRSETEKMVFGVSGGLANYLNTDPTFVRFAFVILALASGIGIPIYILMAIIVPKETDDEIEDIFSHASEDIHSLKAHVADESRQRNNTLLFSAILIIGGMALLMGQVGIELSFILPLLLIGAGLWYVKMNRSKPK